MTTFAQRCIAEIDQSVNSRYVEAFMRMRNGTLSHLSDDDFRTEIALFKNTNNGILKTHSQDEVTAYWEDLCDQELFF